MDHKDILRAEHYSLIRLNRMEYYFEFERLVYKGSVAILGSSITNFLSKYWTFISRISLALIYIGIGIAYYKKVEGWYVCNFE